MKSYRLWLSLALLFLAPALALSGWLDKKADQEPKKEALSGAGKALAFPRLTASKTCLGDVKGVAVASGSTVGAFAVASDREVYYYGAGPDVEWTAGSGEKWRNVEDLAMSADGKRVLFQTDPKPRKSTEAMNLTLRMYDGTGKQVWAKPNPGRYFSALLSPSGKYILIGEHMAAGLSLYDQNLNLLWKKSIQIWSVSFDPREQYLFDGEGGVLYTLDGKRVWSFGRNTRVLSVSDDAEFVLTQYYLTAAAAQSIFLNGRIALKKVQLAGTGGCLSPDGTYTAYVNTDKKLVVYRTRELLENKPDGLPPLLCENFEKPWVMHIARDNRTLFVLGKESNLSSAMMLVDLEKMKPVWKRSVRSDVRTALPTEDNRFVVVKSAPTQVERWQSY